VLTANVNIISAGSTCVMPLGAPAGARITVINEGAAVVTPYPPSGKAFDNRSTNVATGTIAALASNLPGIGQWISDGNGNFFTV
jgi:hypothetical protein